MALMQVCAKYLNRQITIAHMLYLRSVFLILVNSLVLWLTGHAFHVSSPRAFRLILIRMILAATVVYLFFSPVNCISISIINSLWMTVPVWTPLAERLIVGVPTPANLVSHQQIRLCSYSHQLRRHSPHHSARVLVRHIWRC